jgi:hypothetical protein
MIHEKVDDGKYKIAQHQESKNDKVNALHVVPIVVILDCSCF